MTTSIEPTITPDPKAWYQRNRLILPLLLFFPPVGTILVVTSRWNKWVKIPVALVGGFYSLIFLTAMLIDPDATSNRPSESISVGTNGAVTAPAPARKDYDAVIGEAVSIRDRTVTVTSILQSDGLQTNNQFADPVTGTIIYVEFTVQNTGTDSGNIMFSSFELSDGQGRNYSEITDFTYSLWRGERGYGSRGDDMFPGESRQEIAAFRVAPDANNFRMRWGGKTVKLQ